VVERAIGCAFGARQLWTRGPKAAQSCGSALLQPITLTGTRLAISTGRMATMTVRARPGIRETLLSIVCLTVLMSALVAVDVRVREHFSLLFTQVSSESVGTWETRAESFGAAVVQAARDQAVDQAPLLVFAGVGLVLLIFMLRT
jgi:hypothetical protein